MTKRACASYADLYREGHFGPTVRPMKSPGGILDLLEIHGPAGDVSRPALPDLVLYQDMAGGCRICGDLGGGRFDLTTRKGGIILAAPDFGTTTIADTSHRVRSVAFPLAQWQGPVEEAAGGRFSFDHTFLYGRTLDAPTIQARLAKLWALSEEGSAPSRLLARAAGFEILAELYRLGGASFAPAKGGLAPWAKRRAVEMMRERLSEDISLDDLAGEVQLSPFHFARMFKQSLGVPPRVYLTQLRLEKACELLERTDLPVTEIALMVGYSSNQVLARVFGKHLKVSPADYRRAVRDPVRRVASR